MRQNEAVSYLSRDVHLQLAAVLDGLDFSGASVYWISAMQG